MDRLGAMQLFVGVVEQGSLAGASRKAGCSTATVTRAVALLEAQLGVRLLHRTARRLQLTEAGREQLATYRVVLSELTASGLIGGQRNQPATPVLQGHFGITAPELFGTLYAVPVIGDFIALHPGVRVRALLLNRLVNLVEEGIDVAVRLAWLPDSGLMAVNLGEVRRVVCAAPSYLARTGVPELPSDLGRHACIGIDDARERELWRFDRPAQSGRSGTGTAMSVGIQPVVSLNSAGAALDMALRGGGLYRGFSYQVARHLAEGRLVSVLDEYEPRPTPVHLVFHPIPARSTVLRAFIDFAAPRLRDALSAVEAEMETYAAAGTSRDRPHDDRSPDRR
ncbi:LysR family transcriptional regulator [Lichenicola cladoniae]|uniref:LysR family transcriptional regulator n=1 Tax=Lichenicola cladoniae TaxID=1484109 RepID=A0A6M8HPZ2_9PROT|nr:LysR substrate-binding domain-containing protein [Lichenicola cladoniae]NPD69721.1 LysR family transcriptional regulator [Acetobacteraceae bacterium]QKE90422.1 LysR family transcriptional regulator [Lichenicola cladoniae]